MALVLCKIDSGWLNYSINLTTCLQTIKLNTVYSVILNVKLVISFVWAQSFVPMQTLPTATSWGWAESDIGYTPKWMTLDEASMALSVLKHCGFKKGCKSRCLCKSIDLPCTELYQCFGQCSIDRDIVLMVTRHEKLPNTDKYGPDLSVFRLCVAILSLAPYEENCRKSLFFIRRKRHNGNTQSKYGNNKIVFVHIRKAFGPC